MHTKTRYVAVIIFAAVVSAACSPVVPGSAGENSRSITVLGFGEVQGRPDQAEVQVAVETFDKTVAAATDDNEAVVKSVLAALSDAGVAEEDLQTSNFSIWAEQNYDEFGPADIAGYHIKNQLNVLIRDVDRVSAVLEAATDAGANSIYGEFFSLSDPETVEAEARAAAMVNARERATILAELGGVELGDVLIISEVIGSSIPLFGGGGAEIAASAGPSVVPGQLNYSIQIQVTYAIQ